MPIKEAFHTPNDRSGARASGEARREFSMPDVLALQERKDHQGKQLNLVLAKLWKVRGEAARQFGQDVRRRALFSRTSRGFSTPRETVGY
ncbi:hypothetical protein [Deinococcus multiflagellatus]|uniref:Uncharacterized protein n=1 Tax=Deinococcus multiflagellatus TaxID=1656887 RepID=A0ABW1ZTM0_9DEIO